MDNRNSVPENTNSGCFREAVCINAERIYDSCSSKDCLEDLRVYFPDEQQRIINQAASIRMKKAEILTVYLDLEPVTFNRGFYSVDLTYFFRISLEAVSSPSVCPETVVGAAVFSKKVILYGSDGSVKTFSSQTNACENPDMPLARKTSPKAIAQVADPIGLSARLCEPQCCPDACGCSCGLPENICRMFPGSFGDTQPEKVVLATIGIFTIVQIIREVQMLIPTYDFCIPEKECITTTDSPCDLFSRIEFPMNEFFPPKMDCEESCHNPQ